ncbi:MAG: protease, partial [Planctomycetota bacterium]
MSPQRPHPLEGIRVLSLVGDDYEDLELWYPKLRLEEAGSQVTVAGQMAGRT